MICALIVKSLTYSGFVAFLVQQGSNCPAVRRRNCLLLSPCSGFKFGRFFVENSISAVLLRTSLLKTVKHHNAEGTRKNYHLWLALALGAAGAQHRSQASRVVWFFRHSQVDFYRDL